MGWVGWLQYFTALLHQLPIFALIFVIFDIGPLELSLTIFCNTELWNNFSFSITHIVKLDKGLTSAACCHRCYFLNKWWLETLQYKETPLWPEEPSLSHKMILGALFLVIFSESIHGAVPSFGACPDNRGELKISKMKTLQELWTMS